MDHHGLVAAVCRDLDLRVKIDVRSESKRSETKSQYRNRGISNDIEWSWFYKSTLIFKRLQFFESKPIERLLGKEIRAENLDDHRAGKSIR